MDKNTNLNWWKGGVIYQIYPRSFLDTNKDGIGDLKGISQNIDYIKDLGVDGIWISPFFTSPMADFGYDVSNYLDVDPIFGNLDDFKILLECAHKRGIKVIIDQVLSHSSDKHQWFLESKKNKTNAKHDWYVWADPKKDGSPPNNWLSVFGGSAWTYCSSRKQYYLHNFLKCQPDLNFHNEEVQKAQLDNVEFWLKLGVDGFRLDTANFYFHDKKLRDNPANEDLESVNNAPLVNPYAWQKHKYSISQPENLEFLKKLRALMDRYPGSTLVGEIGDDNSLERVVEYCSDGDKLHMAYSFDLLSEKHDPSYIKNVIWEFEKKAKHDTWICWSLGNHDVVRFPTRWGASSSNPSRFSKAAMAFLLGLRGSICIYQGDELGLNESEIKYEDLQDPYALTFWPEFKGRDGCRTPMPWNDKALNAGFSDVKPWLPVDKKHQENSVNVQEQRPDSFLNFTKKLIKFRKENEDLISGKLEFLDSAKNLIVFKRGNKTVLVANFSDEDLFFDCDFEIKSISDFGFGFKHDGSKVLIPSYSCGFLFLI